MTTQSEAWRTLAHQLGFDVVAPFVFSTADGTVEFAAMLPDFGGRAGIVADPDWEKFEPHTSSLRENGYGFSCIEITDNPEGLIEVLSDWEWTSSGPKPDWLKADE